MAMNLQVDPHVERRYKIVRYIGGGAYGIVWKAVDRRTKKLVALKKVFDAFTNDTDAQRTYREAMILLSLHHVNIVKLLNIIRSLTDADLYIVFELQETDVHAVIKANILQDTQRQYIAYQLVRCTHYLHMKGVIHRDLKPANVLINSDCSIKLADFGLARCFGPRPNTANGHLGLPNSGRTSNTNISSSKLDGEGFPDMTVMQSYVRNHLIQSAGDGSNTTADFSNTTFFGSGNGLGGDEKLGGGFPISDFPLTDYIATRWYRAPELLCGTNAYTTSIDLWAIGCIIAELFLGTPLFKGGSTEDQLQLIISAIGPPSQEEIAEWRSATANDVIGKLKLRSLAQEGPYSQLQKQLASLPRDACELVKMLLCLSPSKRLTSLEALQHPYISVFATPEELYGLEGGGDPLAGEALVTIELDDGIKHSVQEYRTALYEQAATLKTGGE